MQMRFGSVAEAVAWADRVALRDGVGSWLGYMSERRGDGKDPARGIRISSGDAKDLALSISCVVSAVSPSIAGEYYRAIHGEHDSWRMMWVSECLAEDMLAARPGDAEAGKARSLAGAMVLCGRMRRGGMYGRVTVAEIARAMGVSRQSLYHDRCGWLIEEGRRITRRWSDAAERSLGESLSDIGVL